MSQLLLRYLIRSEKKVFVEDLGQRFQHLPTIKVNEHANRELVH